ncbi:MAG: putative toxin-antitoxin system toxin component, PIN family [Proteobacteria bacterium]|nr:putative toxin-antitoxin system toxin component, PIN family [Pseudomonadota bacterium]
MGKVQMKRIVIDTNVLINGLLFGGPAAELAELWRNQKIKIFCSREMVQEYLRVLSYPGFRLSVSEVDYLFTHEIMACFEVIQAKPGKAYVKEDPEDDKFIWCAIACGAKAVVSGDAHLLNLKKSSVPVLSVMNFLKKTKPGL